MCITTVLATITNNQLLPLCEVLLELSAIISIINANVLIFSKFNVYQLSHLSLVCQYAKMS